MFQFPGFASLAGYSIRSGLPHSEIAGSKLIRSSPTLIAAYHVLHRLLSPRHPPNALLTLDYSHYRCSSFSLPVQSTCGRPAASAVTAVRLAKPCGFNAWTGTPKHANNLANDHPIIKTSFLRSIQQPCGQASFLLNAGPSKSASHEGPCQPREVRQIFSSTMSRTGGNQMDAANGYLLQNEYLALTSKGSCKKWIT